MIKMESNSDSKYNVDNNKCVLVEFINEGNKIQTGYLAWLSKSCVNRIDEIIQTKEDVVISWPNIDPAQATVMRNKLKTATFKSEAVHILAYGEWTEMRSKQMDYERHGSPKLNVKGRRRIRNQKFLDTDDDNENTEEPKSKKKKSCNESMKKLNKMICAAEPPKVRIQYDDDSNTEYTDESDLDASKSFEAMITDKSHVSVLDDKNLDSRGSSVLDKGSSPKKNDGIEVSSELSNNKSLVFFEKNDDKDLSEKHTEVENNDENVKPFMAPLKSTEEQYKALQVEYNKLNADLDYYKDRYEHSTESNNFLREKLCSLEKEVYSQLHKNQKLKSIIETSYKDWNTVYPLVKKNITNFEEILANDNIAANEEDIKAKQKESSCKREPFKPILKNDSMNKLQQKRVEEENDFSVSMEDAEENSKEKENTKDKKEKQENVKEHDGNDKTKGNKEVKNAKKFVITEEMKKKCRKDSVSHYTCDLLHKVFTLKELATSSVKGMQCNANIKKGITVVKPALEKARLKAIEKCVLNKFGFTSDNRSLIHAVTRRKLSESARIYKEQGGLSDEEEEEEERKNED